MKTQKLRENKILPKNKNSKTKGKENILKNR